MGKHVDIDLSDDQVIDPAVADEDGPLAADGAQVDVVDDGIDPLDKLPDHAIQNADGSVTLPLQMPVTLQIKKNDKVRTEKYERLVFHRLTGADQRAIASASSESSASVAFARSLRFSQAVMNVLFDRMDMADISAGGQVLNSFTVIGRKTGK